MSRKMTVAEAGRRGGLKGGQSKSAAKVAAVQKNLEKARRIRLTRLNKAV